MDILLLYACCIPVKGARRSIVCDVQRQKFHFIPNALFEILTQHKNKPVSVIKQFYNNSHDEIIDSYVEFLISNELGFLTSEPEKFPDIDTKWDSSSLITNAIVDIDRFSNHPYKGIIEQLDGLNCMALELRFYDSIETDEILAILSLAQTSRLRSIDLLLPYSPQYSFERLESIAEYNKRVNKIVIHSAPHNKISNSRKSRTILAYITDVIDNASHCGIVSLSHFRVNLPHITEAIHYNSCLNRKIAIDVKGMIKNCPAMTTQYGSVQETSLEMIALDISFQTLWSITKDDISVCRDCEFRYICTDCRAFIQPGDANKGKPSKCSYDPYSATWLSKEDDPGKMQYQFKESKSAIM